MTDEDAATYLRYWRRGAAGEHHGFEDTMGQEPQAARDGYRAGCEARARVEKRINGSIGKREKQQTPPASTVVRVKGMSNSFTPTGTCQHCGKRPATEWWVGEGGMLEWTHGIRAAWCKRCCLEEQLKFAREQAGRVAEIEDELEHFK